jgi:predicted RNA-binding protein with PIN domain
VDAVPDPVPEVGSRDTADDTASTDRIRGRLVTLAADALGRLDVEQVPAPLRRVAGFAPMQRARLGGDRIVETCEVDAGFRSRLALEIRKDLPDEPVDRDVAVLAWLERPKGWEDTVARTAEDDRDRQERAAGRAALQRADKLQLRLDEAAEVLREARQRGRDEAEALRRENADLRRKLGESRQQARRSAEETAELRSTAEQADAVARASQAVTDAEARRLRARITELEQRLGRAQREVRLDRDEASLRARLLLDSVIDAAAGLRRELALPTTEGAPADRVAADEGEAGHRASSGTGSMRTDDPALLAQLLAVPRTHLLVDGYNVTKTAWPEASLEVQRDRLFAGLAGLGARTGSELTVVFDAAETTGQRPLVHAPRGVRVRFTPVGVIADDLIREFVAAEPEGRPVVVVTSDRAVVTDVVRKRGVRAVDALALVRLLARG